MKAVRGSRLAIIDLGTNSVRFDVHEIASRRTRRLLHRDKLMVRLGENLFSGGKLDRNAARRTLQAMASFRRTADDLRVDKIVAFGTSALREATDAESLLRAIRDEVGIEVRVISGPEEARLIAMGVLANETNFGSDTALVDIGGGSTEISVVRERRIVFCESFPLGAARLQQVFLKSTPPAGGAEAVRALRRHVREIFSKAVGDDFFRVPRILGSSGTVKAVAKLCRKGSRGKSFDVDRLAKLTKKIAGMTAEELLEQPGMEPKRVDLILAGSLLLEECARLLGAKKITFTEYALRDGILAREVQLLELQHRLDSQVDLAPLYAQAARFGTNGSQLRRHAELAEGLFVRLQPLHRMSERWLTYLKLAILFRNSGKLISPIEHERHSCYIVRHADLPLYEPWETEFVALLCLHHNGTKSEPESLPFAEKESRCFHRLLALLRVLDALDPAFHGRLRLDRARIERNAVHLTLSGASKSELARLKLQQKQDLFERLFRRELLIHFR